MQKLTAEDLYQFRFPSQLKFSPSGKALAFTVNQCNAAENRYDCSLWLWDGQKLSELEAARGLRGYLWLSDDEILFSGLREQPLKDRAAKGEKLTGFYLLSLRTRQCYPAFTIPAAVSGFDSFHGGLVLQCRYSRDDVDFSGMTPEQKEEAYAAIKAEKDYQVLDEYPFWENGGGYTNGQRPRLYTCSLSGENLRPVTSETFSVSGYRAVGEKLYFYGTDFTGVRGLTQGIFCFDPAAGSVTTVLPDGEYSIHSLDMVGGKLVFTGVDRARSASQQNAAFYQVLDSGSAVLLYDGDEVPGASTASDCRFGASASVVSGQDGIFFTAAQDTRGVLRFWKPGQAAQTVIDPDGSVDGIAVSGQQIAWIGMKGLQLEEVYLTENGQTRQISNFNGWVMRERLIAPLHPLTAYSNGDTISGFYLEPVQMEQGKKYPVILDIHGGPKMAYGSVFYHEMQCWANQGYFVFFCNPHGSEGRGYRFADNRGRFGWEDYEDIMSFVDTALAACPQADSDKMGVTGGSYGGYMTNWIIGHTDRFKAAASQRSIASWMTSILTSDIGFFGMKQCGTTPWENPESIWEHSPVKYADRCKTPTLFIHSDEDYRCWMVEGIQMFTALKMHGIDTRLCLFHGENHGLSRSGKPLHRIRRLNEIQNWMDKYLK